MDITVKDPGRGTRWVCPNDRHLALRAKLRIGWSVKTGSLDSKWGNYSNSYTAPSNRCAQSFVLSEGEQQAIIEVIQRAEALDLSEQERVGRLVERLENMKRNVCIVTRTRMNEKRNCSSRCSNSTHCVCSCALCGEKFGAVLGATPNLCKDCRKYICQKCGIETTELNSAFQNTTSTKSVLDRTTMQRIVRRSNNSQKQFLCRICAETREMWKKSGAWFIKGMPKYILPEKKISQCIDKQSIMRYSEQEKIEMVLIYGEARECLREAIRIYEDRFPERSCPSRSAYSSIVKTFCETGSVNRNIRLRRKTVTHEANVNNIIAKVNQNSHVSIRQHMGDIKGYGLSRQAHDARKYEGTNKSCTICRVSPHEMYHNGRTSFRTFIAVINVIIYKFKYMVEFLLPLKSEMSLKERGWSRICHKQMSWTVGGNKSLELIEPHDSSSDEEVTRLSPFSNSAQSAGSVSKISPGQRSNDLSLLNNREECSDQLDRSTLSITSQCSRVSPTFSVTSSRLRTNGKTTHEPQIEQRVSFEDEIVNEKVKKSNNSNDVNNDTRRIEFNTYNQLKNSQVQSLRLNSPMVPMKLGTTIIPTEQTLEHIQIKEKRLGQDVSQSCLGKENPRSNNQIDSSHRQMLEHEVEHNYGTLEISLRYDPTVQCLQCKVERARDLRPMDIHGLADPFCKLNILPVNLVASTKCLRTKTVHKTRNPEFNEILNFYGTTETDIWNGKALHILILQDDPTGQDFLGEARFPLHELQPRQTKHYNVPLQDYYPVDNEEAAWGVFSSGRGKIEVTLSYCTKRRALTVMVQQAANLLPMDSNGFSDPFVKLCLIENVTNNQKQRVFDYSIARITGRKFMSKKIIGRNSQNTTIKWKTLNPDWNEEFIFTTRLTDLTKLALYITVWDKDLGKNNDYLGGLELSCNSKGARLKHWIDAIKFPDQRHQAWHNLTDTIFPTE